MTMPQILPMGGGVRPNMPHLSVSSMAREEMPQTPVVRQSQPVMRQQPIIAPKKQEVFSRPMPKEEGREEKLANIRRMLETIALKSGSSQDPIAVVAGITDEQNKSPQALMYQKAAKKDALLGIAPEEVSADIPADVRADMVATGAFSQIVVNEEAITSEMSKVQTEPDPAKELQEKEQREQLLGRLEEKVAAIGQRNEELGHQLECTQELLDTSLKTNLALARNMVFLMKYLMEKEESKENKATLWDLLIELTTYILQTMYVDEKTLNSFLEPVSVQEDTRERV